MPHPILSELERGRFKLVQKLQRKVKPAPGKDGRRRRTREKVEVWELDATSTIVAIDGDCDGTLTEEDCNGSGRTLVSHRTVSSRTLSALLGRRCLVQGLEFLLKRFEVVPIA